MRRDNRSFFAEVVVAVLAWSRGRADESAYYAWLDSPVGNWSVAWTDMGLREINVDKSSKRRREEEGFGEILPIWLEKAWEVFWEGKKPQVTYVCCRPLPDFTKRVYEIVAEIPSGDVCTYGEIAKCAGNAKAARAVGSIMRNNPWALFIPCHRVLGSDGSLCGYGGPSGVALKKRLLKYEADRNKDK